MTGQSTRYSRTAEGASVTPTTQDVERERKVSASTMMSKQELEEEERREEMRRMGIKVRDFAREESATAPTPVHGSADGTKMSRIPEWWDPYLGIAMYDFHLKKREREAPRGLTRAATQQDIAATPPATPEVSEAHIEGHHHGLQDHRRTRWAYTPPLQNSEIIFQDQYHKLLTHTYPGYPHSHLHAVDIPIPGKLTSRLLAIGWITRDEAAERWLPIDFEALRKYEERPHGPYPFTTRVIPQRTLPNKDARISWMNKNIADYNNNSLTPISPRQRGYQNDAISTHRDRTPVPTRAGIFVYPDGDVYSPAERARRGMFFGSGADRGKLAIRWNSWNDAHICPEASIPDGVGNDIPSTEDREAILLARIRYVSENLWPQLKFHHMCSQDLIRNSAVAQGEENANGSKANSGKPGIEETRQGNGRNLNTEAEAEAGGVARSETGPRQDAPVRRAKRPREEDELREKTEEKSPKRRRSI